MLISKIKQDIVKLKKQLATSTNIIEKSQIKVSIASKNNEIKDLVFRVQRFYNNPKFESVLTEINSLQHKQQEIIDNSWKDKFAGVKYLRTLQALIKFLDDSEVSFYIENIDKKDAEYRRRLANFFHGKIKQKYGDNLNTQTLERFDFVNCQYLSQLLECSDTDNIKSLFALIDKYPNKSITEIFNGLQQNKDTKKLFEKYNLNYNKWVNFDENSYIKFNLYDGKTNAIDSIVKNIEADLNDELWKYIPQCEREKLIDSINSAGFATLTNYEGKTLFTKSPQDFTPSDLEKLDGAIDRVLRNYKNKFWSSFSEDKKVHFAKMTILEHFSQRWNELNYAKINKLFDEKKNAAEITVRKVNMNDILHSLFLGNHSCCCTAIGHSVNQESAPNYIKNKMVSAIEILANGKPIGNTMCYVALVNGAPSLILDNLEFKSDYQYNPQITKAIWQYAEKLCKEIGGANMNIYAGAVRHKVMLSDFEKANYEIKFLGSTDKDKIYLDFCSSKQAINPLSSISEYLYKINR